MNKFQVVFYEKENGNCPMIEFLDSLDVKKRAKVLRTIEILENNGNDLREPYSKLIGEGIFELRVKQGSDIMRVLYFFYVGRKIIITHGFVKKTQKTPQSEITRALMCRRDSFRTLQYE